MCRTRVVLQGIIHVCNFFFNDDVCKVILHILLIMGLSLFEYNENKLVKLVYRLINNGCLIQFFFIYLDKTIGSW
mgnify:CR=1 FL=1